MTSRDLVALVKRDLARAEARHAELIDEIAASERVCDHLGFVIAYAEETIMSGAEL